VLVRPAETPGVRDGQTVVDRVVAVVNGEPILMSELVEQLAFAQREGRSPEGQPADLERSVLDRMVDHRLVIQEARREKIEVTEDELRAQMDEFVTRNGGDREKIEVQLRQQGITWGALQREIREQMLAQRIRGRRVARRASVTEAEVDQYLAESRPKLEAGLKYRVRHLALLAQPPDEPAAWDRARLAAEAVAAQVAAGADFAALVRERGAEAGAAGDGDLGWLARGELAPELEAAILRLRRGELTPPVRSGPGYHLFQLEDREELTPALLAEARQQARDVLFQRKAQARQEEWLEGLRRHAQVSIRL
jgi:peptidyl-prolyl cis-trans isomerase SurA